MSLFFPSFFSLSSSHKAERRCREASPPVWRPPLASPPPHSSPSSPMARRRTILWEWSDAPPVTSSWTIHYFPLSSRGGEAMTVKRARRWQLPAWAAPSLHHCQGYHLHKEGGDTSLRVTSALLVLPQWPCSRCAPFFSPCSWQQNGCHACWWWGRSRS